jgi:cysteine desulfurase
MVSQPVYLDHNATTPCDQRVVDAMLPFFRTHYGNAASRSHSFGWQAEEAVEIARQQVAELIGCHVQELVFTSGATEADNLAIKGVFETYGSKGKHIITVATEHKAVLDTCSHLEKLGAEVTYLGVRGDGRVEISEIEAAIRTDTILIAVMYANNETGILQPIAEIGELAKTRKILFFSDATQAVGKIPVSVSDSKVDVMAFSSHKLYGPKGIGALYVRRRDPRVKLTAQMDGGGHERGMRSGTLNVPGIVGFGTACAIAREELENDVQQTSRLRNRLEEGLLKLPDTSVNGAVQFRLPNVSNVSFRHVDGQALLGGLNKSIAVSSGSACMSATMEPSYVLKAMGVEDDLAFGSIRFSLGRANTEQEIGFVIEEVRRVVDHLRTVYEQIR